MTQATGGYTRAVSEHGSDSAEATQAAAKIQSISDQYNADVREDEYGPEALAAVILTPYRQHDTVAYLAVTLTPSTMPSPWLSGHQKFAQAVNEAWRGVAAECAALD